MSFFTFCFNSIFSFFSPQYLLWPAFLLPLLDPEILKTRFWKINLLIILISLALTQYVYPVDYETLIYDFYHTGANAHTFLALAVRNLLLVILTVRIFFDIFRGERGKLKAAVSEQPEQS